MSTPNTKPFPLHAVLGLATGRVWGGTFGDIHECAEHLMGHPIWTHEFASKDLFEEMRRRVLAFRPEFAIITEDETPSSPENAPGRLAAAVARFGVTVDVPLGDATRTKGPMETAAEMMPNAKVVAVSVPPSPTRHGGEA